MSNLNKSKTVNFADVAHGTLIFDKANSWDALILKLVDTAWVQRLRRISQTGNTKLVYMFAEHSRFGHSLGVAYLASLLLKHLEGDRPEIVREYGPAIGAAAILHDIGHLAPGSHLAESVWTKSGKLSHEDLTMRVIKEDPEISGILDSYSPGMKDLVVGILDEDPSLPPWVTSLVSGGGWNVDRGNWSIVDSVMCAVSYGRYNVTALIDAFRISDTNELVLQESRLDALSHFFVARNSMYRQIYQHRVLQVADAMTKSIVRRIRERGEDASGVFMDPVMKQILFRDDIFNTLSLRTLFTVDEAWWSYHLSHWCEAEDKILSDLASRLFNRKLFKTLPLEKGNDVLVKKAHELSKAKGLDPAYYVIEVREKDSHRDTSEEPPKVFRESGEIVRVKDVEPLVEILLEKSGISRGWLAVTEEVKRELV